VFSCKGYLFTNIDDKFDNCLAGKRLRTGSGIF
jgi:hypothetical protein